MTLILRLRTLAPLLLFGSSACADHGPSPAADSAATDTSSIVVSYSGAAGPAYLTLQGGSVPRGVFALVSHRGSGIERLQPVRAGGFDPLSVEAAVGDSVHVAVRDSAGQVLYETTARVPPPRRPRVVRTSPPRRRADVPLNAIITIVFSEPIDVGTITPGNIRLLANGAPLQGTLVADSEGLIVRLSPLSLLQAQTEYILEVSTEVRDRSGEPLETLYRSDFTTGSSTAELSEIWIREELPLVAPGEFMQLSVNGTGAGPTRYLENLPVEWSSSNPAIAFVSSNGVLRGISEGQATIRARAGSLQFETIATVAALRFSSIAVGVRHACALTTAGAAYCWGSNGSAQLGIGPEHMRISEALTPVRVAGNIKFVSLSAAWDHTCGIALEGDAYCWGGGLYKALGAPASGACLVERNTRDPGCSHVPTLVVGGLKFRVITTGASHTCGLTVDSTAVCWGNNWTGELGVGDTVFRGEPVKVVGDLRFKALDAGWWRTCGVASDGAAYCWGVGSELGAGPVVPTRMQSGTGTYAAVSAGVKVCALRDSGIIDCWSDSQTSPTPWSDQQTYRSLDIGLSNLFSLCALTPTNAPYCWRQSAELVPGGLEFESLGTGWYHNCGISTNSRAYCWGSGGSWMGNGLHTSSSTVPLRIKGQP